MSNNLGMGVMLGYLGGNEETVTTLKSSLGKTIKRVWLDEDSDALRFEFEDGTKIRIFDDGQSCCEHRYMRTDDDLTYYAGTKLLNVEVKDAPDQEDEYGDVHEIQFLDITTNKGVFTMSNHNDHSGYYGGFCIVCKPD